MITSKDNQLIKYVKSLSQKKYRDLNKEYIVEGAKMVKEALENGENVTKIILCDGFKFDNINNYINNIEVEIVSDNIFKYIADTMSPQGILAVVKEKENISKKYSNIIFALDDLQDPGNLGTIIRTLDAAGYKDLILSKDTADVYNPKVVRSTMGGIFRLNLYKNINLLEEIPKLKKQGYKIVVTDLDTNKYYYDLDFNDKLVVVVGNESKGVSEEIKSLADTRVIIPMIGKTESLNAAVATSIIAYEGVRQKFAPKK